MLCFWYIAKWFRYIYIRSKVKSLSRVWLFVTPWAVAYQAPLSMGFPRQEYWSGLPLPSPRQHIKKQRHYIAYKGPSSQSYVFSSSRVWMWELDYKKKAEPWRTDAFELWCWRRLFGVSWTARRSNQSIPKEISPEYSLQGLMLKLKLQYFGCLMQRTDSLDKTLMLGKIEGRKRRRWQRMRCGWYHRLNGHEFE